MRYKIKIRYKICLSFDKKCMEITNSIEAKPEFTFFKVSVFDVLRSASDAPWPEDVDSRPEIAVRVENVGFVNDLLFHKNFGPNVVFETLDFWPNFLHVFLHLGLEK